MEIFLYRQQNLLRIHRLYQIVGNLIAHGLVHNVFFLTLGNHYDRDMGCGKLDSLQGFKSGKTGHILVEDYQVEVLPGNEFKSVGAAAGSDHIVALAFEKHYMRFEKVDFIIGP